jgi:succinate dehydrogenase cytochrome b subunit
MSWFTDLYRSAVGKKAVMAVTGIILFGFIVVHMIGNLKLYEAGTFMQYRGQAYQPVRYLDAYGFFLRHVGEPLVPAYTLLWIFRAVLLLAVVLHIWAAWQVTRMSQTARPREYVSRPKIHTTYASRTMRWGGVIILLFVIYHLLHLTVGAHVAPQTFVENDPYHNVVAGFTIWWVAAIYIVANLALGFHLYHGVWSMFNSIGWNHPKFNPWKRNFATTFAVLITAANISFPLAVLIGIVR